MRSGTCNGLDTYCDKAGRGEWIGLALLALACVLYAMDLTALHLAAPKLGEALKPSSAQLLWIIDLMVSIRVMGNSMAKEKTAASTATHVQTEGSGPAMQELDRLVGTWHVAGEAEGQVIYEWMEGGRFLVQHVDLTQANSRMGATRSPGAGSGRAVDTSQP